MAKIKAPNKEYNGTSAGVLFTNGIGETTDPALIGWFRSHGYAVEVEKTPDAAPAEWPSADEAAWVPEEKPRKRTRKRGGK